MGTAGPACMGWPPLAPRPRPHAQSSPPPTTGRTAAWSLLRTGGTCEPSSEQPDLNGTSNVTVQSHTCPGQLPQCHASRGTELTTSRTCGACDAGMCTSSPARTTSARAAGCLTPASQHGPHGCRRLPYRIVRTAIPPEPSRLRQRAAL